MKYKERKTCMKQTVKNDHCLETDKGLHKDLEEYFRFINYSGPAQPNLETLRELQLLHTLKVPFENLNPLLKYPVNIDIESVKEKLLRKGRGGYCFEQNALFSHILKLVGFKVKGLAARVLWNLPEGVLPPRGHMLLLVDIGGDPYITDVGFGGLSLTGPLKFILDQAQETPHEPFRIVDSGEEFILQAFIREEWRDLYQFGLMEQLQQDYEAPNWYISNHPNSHFTFTLLAARPKPGKRYNLRNNELTTHQTHGPSEKRIILDPGELKDLLTDTFEINISGLEGLDEKLAQIVQDGAK